MIAASAVTSKTKENVIFENSPSTSNSDAVFTLSDSNIRRTSLKESVLLPFSMPKGTCSFTGGHREAENSRQLSNDPKSTDADEWAVREHWTALCSKLLSIGEEAVSDIDLLTLLLFYLNPAGNARKLAMQLISRFETFGNVVSARYAQISAVAEIEPKVVDFLQLIRAAGTRLAREEISHRPVIDAWDKLLTYLRSTMAHQTVEEFRVLFLDRSNTLIADEVQHRGTIDHTPVYPREVVRRALEFDASAIIIVHNHPSNRPVPSKADIQMTKIVCDALERVGIVLHDHIIISRRGHSSLRSMGLLGTKVG
jgi:DNA repair protein RadC